MATPQFQKFDVVQLRTVRHIGFLSGPKNHPTSPQGHWQIVGFVREKLMLAKEDTIILVPPDAVRKVASYDRERFLEKRKGSLRVQRDEDTDRSIKQGSG